MIFCCSRDGSGEDEYWAKVKATTEHQQAAE